MTASPGPDRDPDLDEQQALRRLWQETTPIEPAPAAWQRVQDNLAQAQRRLLASRRRRQRAPLVALVAAACVALLAWGVVHWLPSKPVIVPPAHEEAEAVLPVAAADEVVILRVEGDDTQTLVVGQLPVHGPLELAEPGEVIFTSIQPDARDQMVPHVRSHAGCRPMIWARAEADAMPED
jgi:hypothetical protein